MMMRWLLPVSLGLVLNGCAMGLKPEGAPPRPEAVTGILFRANAETLSEHGAQIDTAKLAETVSKNLGAWGFPITADATEGHSHLMEPRVSAVEKGSTPTGFSFGLGNADPRSLEFQKAEVVTVTCTLRGAAARSHENAYLKETFVADEVMKQGTRNQGKQALFDAYVNHIGTACFNLLSQLKVRRSKPDPQHTPGTAPSTWFPDVRIEVREKPAHPTSAPNPKVTPAPAPTPAPAATTAPPADAPESAPSAVQTEIREGEVRKQMVIHNQGSPIILEFGYERK